MYKMKINKAYMKSITECVKCPKGEIVELPEDIAKAWLKHGFCEEVKKSFSPVIETAVVDPVVETKAKKKKK